MAATTGTTDAVVKAQLLANGERYAYFQAIRLLRLFSRADGTPLDSLRTRPQLTLGFPETDIERIEPRPQGGYQVSANFFGLYGVASPLPTFYTEDLLDEQREGRHATRDFLDILHDALYPLLFDAWSKYRLPRRLIEEDDRQLENLLYAFVGLDDPNQRARLPYASELLRYAGLFSQRPRSVLGLQTLLADCFSPARVVIDCAVPTMVPIPVEQRLCLGNRGQRLGENAFLGSEIEDVSSHIAIHLQELPAPLFHRLLPGGSEHQRLRFLVTYYLTDPLTVVVVLELRHGEAKTARTCGTTDGPWSRLGLDTWLAPETAGQPTRTVFTL
ncbi:type VI secretion system protein ImpH [Oryzomicrobium terrae]|uniref:Type VI secretion system protein ImpH n=1 Tax=Oryzomicrobium terrae TaxID=1735038 RepID=A0A5C1EBR1_9RHOO|nr:type VI secretion system protein ImpH [Oryzomicrobium terrae]